MKAAFISDVHGNLEALEATLAHASDCEAIFCCGDAVGYGDKPNEVCEILRRLDIPGVVGNHDLMAVGKLDVAPERDFLYQASWTRSVLTPENLAWLAALPEQLNLVWQGHRVILRHASPWDVTTYLYPNSSNLDQAVPRDGSILAVGHSHHAFVRPGPQGCLVNCGSVGFPRSGPAGAQYLVLDSIGGSWAYRNALYDIPTVQARLRAQHWSAEVIEKLAQPSRK
jgi:predicted phosphodiesterase